MMIRHQSPLVQALVGSLFTWGLTALGAGCVAFISAREKHLLDVSLGFAAGVMTAASFWSLLAPAIEITETQFKSWAFVPVCIGFFAGAAFVHFADRVLPFVGVADSDKVDPTTQSEENECRSYHTTTTESHDDRAENLRRRNVVDRNFNHVSGYPADQDQDLAVSWRRIFLLIVAITVHNIPEGLAVGVGFGAAGKSPSATFERAWNLALGIGIQNFPEGLAVSLPLAGFGYSKMKSFWYGQLSGMVEPFAAVLGAAGVSLVEPLLPYALSFAAGAMIYVVLDDIIPEAQAHGNGKLASWGGILGFMVMMSLDVGLS